jgi:DNA polymerase III epsilon subunit-like protein
MSDKKNQLYCSLDIETSGFDPAVNEILEVGFAFFTIEENKTSPNPSFVRRGILVTEEWSQVFKPSKEVPPQILGLTGITQAELDEAPQFTEYQKFLQEKLGNGIIVGHNVGFDIKFLQSFGLKFSGPVVDTLDLVQFLLPTHHSYNLENLMHTFGIRHKEAHRALPDAKATITVLEKLLGIYCGFPQKLKAEIQQLIKHHPMPWQDLLKVKLPAVQLEKKQKPLAIIQAEFKFKLQPKKLYSLPLGRDYFAALAKALSRQKERVLLVVPTVRQVMALWQSSSVEPVFPGELLFNEAKFRAVLKKKDLSFEEARFLLKVLVWQHTNWQTKTILDLNLSFFGGQFKELIAGCELTESKRPFLVCASQQTFLEISRQGLYKDRMLSVVGLSEFEQTCSWNIGLKLGWGQVIYALKNIYNPELNVGDVGKKEQVLDLLMATDLFFGLVSALLKTSQEGFCYYKIDEAAKDSAAYGKVRKAAENFIAKLGAFGQDAQSESLRRYAKNLQDFFAIQDNRVKWVELAENRCVFYSSPIDIAGIVKAVLAPFKKVALFDALGLAFLADYFLKRLGLEGFKVSKVSLGKTTSRQKLFAQGDLFGQANIGPPAGRRPCVCELRPENLAEKDLLDILKKEALPAAILFPSAMAAKQFYNQHYQTLKGISSVFLQSSSGGSNKILRNFQIHHRSILLATDRFILKFISNQSTFDSMSRLMVKTLVISRLPFESYTHPYQEAVSASFPDPFLGHSLPKALYNFHLLLGFFNTEKLEKIYLYDSKLQKDYARVFKDYLEEIDNFKII